MKTPTPRGRAPSKTTILAVVLLLAVLMALAALGGGLPGVRQLLG